MNLKKPILTDRESEIMQIVWRLGHASGADVRQRLPDEPAESTVRTMLGVLVRKGYLSREGEPRNYTYQAAVGQAEAARSALRRIIDRFFEGSGQSLVLNMIENEELADEEQAAIRKMLEQNGGKRT